MLPFAINGIRLGVHFVAGQQDMFAVSLMKIALPLTEVHGRTNWLHPNSLLWSEIAEVEPHFGSDELRCANDFSGN
jgi:hypothetical protein